ncbi:MAG: ABC transporter permease [bacterium]|nr:ABC transporter permease [bacterium]
MSTNEHPIDLDLEPEAEAPAEVELYSASQWRLMARKFRKHRLAVWAGMFMIVLYLIAIFCEFLAPYGVNNRHSDALFAPPQRLHLVSDEGLHFWPFVYALEGTRDAETRQLKYTEDHSRRLPIRLFVRGDTYRFWGLFESNIHAFGVGDGGSLFLLGADSLGRDLFTRILYGSRISLTIGLVGVGLSFVLGLVMGSISGYFGGWIDNLIQRFIEILRSFPTLPLWMALSAAVPTTWSPIQMYFGITLVLSLIGWGGLARQVRGKILSLREEDYVTAAVFSGASRGRVMWRHLLPGFASHIIVSITLAVPGMILGETALSFLGLGLRPPAVSWGVLLKDAQNVQAVALHPWLLTPVLFVVLTVLAFNFVGDGLRDAADPYSR